MRTGWTMWPTGLSPTLCDEIISRGKELQPTEGLVRHGSRTDEKKSEIRRSILRWMDIQGRDKDIVSIIMSFIKQANKFTFGFDIIELSEVQFTEYHGSNNGVYNWHNDLLLDDVSFYMRKLSFIAQLSDEADYEGGNLEFFVYDQPGEGFRQKGAVIVFPSFVPHRITPVTSGTRHSLVSWVEGPRFR